MRCPKEGTRVRFNPTPVSRALYSRAYCLPKTGASGVVTSIPTGRGRRTCMPGPGGGLVYVAWDGGCTVGVSSYDVEKVKGGGFNGARRRVRRGR